MSNVEETALRLLREVTNELPADLSRETAVRTAGISSLDLVELVFAIEEHYDIEIPYNANDAETHFRTLGDMIDLVEKLIAGKAAAASAST